MGCARILLADDHQAMLETVSRVLAVDFDIVGTVGDGEQAVQAVVSLDPDVVVLDISMPVMNGFEAASCLRQSGARAKVIFLTAQTNQDFVSAAFSAGALGYVLKTRLMTDLVPAVREVLEGRTFASPCLGTDETARLRSAVEVQDSEPELVGRADGRSEL